MDKEWINGFYRKRKPFITIVPSCYGYLLGLWGLGLLVMVKVSVYFLALEASFTIP